MFIARLRASLSSIYSITSTTVSSTKHRTITIMPKRSVEGDVKSSGKAKSTPESILESGWFEKSSSKIYIGAHVSAAGGVENAVKTAAAIGCQSFALFLCNQRSWNVKDLTDESAQIFRDTCIEYGYPSHLILPHASYLVNCGSHDKELLSKSRSMLLDGIKRCEKLGIDYYNFHPGSSCGKIEASESCKLIAESINWVHSVTSKATLRKYCKLCLSIFKLFLQSSKI